MFDTSHIGKLCLQLLCTRARSPEDNQSQRERESGRYQSGQYHGGQHQGGSYRSDDRSSGYVNGGYPSGGYAGVRHQYGQNQTSSGPGTPPPSPGTLAAIRSSDQRNTAALAQQQAGLSQIQARVGQYLGYVTSNLEPQDRGTAPSSSYRYPTTISESFDQQERRQERQTSSSSSRNNASGADSQERTHERGTVGRPSRNAHASSGSREHRGNPNSHGRYE